MYRHYDPITYRHPRTTMDAFGCDASNANPVQVFKSSILRRFWNRNKHWLRRAGYYAKWVTGVYLLVLLVVYANL